MSIVLLVTRPDFEWWFLLPPSGLLGGGHVIIIKLERRQMSSRMADLKEELEMERMRAKHKERMTSSWYNRHFEVATMMVVCVIVVGLGGMMWFMSNGLEGVRELLELFGCGC